MKKVCIIVGPTGVGKTSLSIELAKKFNGEIISGDSMQVYKEMSIGTAKIKKEEMQGIPHHLVDCYNFDEEYHVKLFQEKARAAIDDITSRGKLPIICGGTGLYIKSVLYDYQFSEDKEDDEFIQFLNTRSKDELYGLLQVIDPKSCEKIHKNNTKRVIRCLCIAHSGEKKSDSEEKQKHEMIYDAYIIGLTLPREQLYQRINDRVDMMMDEGLFEEIKYLTTLKENVWNLQSMQGIGYKEWKQYFTNEASIDDCVELIKKNSRNFAKRQYTWFNNQMEVHWYDKNEEYQTKISEDVEKWLK